MLNILLALKRPSPALTGALGGHAVELLPADEPALGRLAKKGYDLLVIEGGNGLLASIKEADPRIEVFLVGAEGMDEVEAVRLGASACFPEPVDIERLMGQIRCIDDIVEVRRETASLEKQLSEKYTFAGIVGRNPRMLEIFNYLRRIAPYFKTVTVFGETGSGKEEIAKALHSASPGAKEPFLACNCGGFVETLLGSELFGHKKGAFTGAVSDKAGIFEAAGEGTVFLDEIGDLPLSFQPHLLRVLQNGDFRRLGSNQNLKARCRILAATNKDLAREVREGRFREDLYFRLTPLTVNLPPLRERKDDIPLLCRFILNRFHQRTGKKILGISSAAQTVLMSYDWPGNVRQLENVLEHVSILANEAFIRLEDLPTDIRDAHAGQENYSPSTLEDVIKKHIETVLKQCNGNRTTAARVLGISRRALLRKIEKYDSR